MKKEMCFFLSLFIFSQIQFLAFSFFMNEFQTAETEYFKTNHKSGKLFLIEDF